MGTSVTFTRPTIRTAFGGSKSTTEDLGGLRRAKTDDKPRIRSQNKFKGDEILTRQGHKGAQVLGRIAKGRPALPKVVAEKQAPKLREKPTTTDTGQTIGAQPQQQPDTVKTPHEKLQDAVSECLNKLSKLSQKPELDKLSTPKERLKAELEHTGSRAEIKVTADKLLHEVSTGLKSKSEALSKKLMEGTPPRDPEVLQLMIEITQLKAGRTKLVETQIRLELNGLGSLTQEPIHKGSAMAALWALHGPGDVSKHPKLNADLIKEISDGVDAFNEGAQKITLKDGTTVDLAGFSERISKLVDDGATLGKTEAGQRSLDELRNLSRSMTARSDFQAVVETFEGILDKTPDFPVGGAIVSFSHALPSLGKAAQRTDPHSLELAAGGLRTLAEMVSKGDIFPSMINVDPAVKSVGTKVAATANSFDVNTG